MGLSEDFAAAQEQAKALKVRPSNEELLELYSLYKQATAGDVEGKRPGMLDPKGRAKFDAWAARRGLGKDSAMSQYVALVARLRSAG